MAEHPAVGFLARALDRAEQTAHGYGNTWPQVNYVMVHGPAEVLRRVAADRQILAEHQPTREGPARRSDSWDPCELPGCPCAVEDRVPACGMCASGHAYDAVVEHWPCRTVRLLAEAWGWTEDAA